MRVRRRSQDGAPGFFSGASGAVFQQLDEHAERRRPHHRRLPRLDHRPQLHRLRPAGQRRILRKIAEGATDKASLGDVSTLADPSIVDALVAGQQG